MPTHKVMKKHEGDPTKVTEWKEWIDDVLVFDVQCDQCNYGRHRCPGCGDMQRHDGVSTHDGHTPEECFAYD